MPACSADSAPNGRLTTEMLLNAVLAEARGGAPATAWRRLLVAARGLAAVAAHGRPRRAGTAAGGAVTVRAAKGRRVVTLERGSMSVTVSGPVGAPALWSVDRIDADEAAAVRLLAEVAAAWPPER